MKNLIFALLISFYANAQLEYLSPEELEQKIQLDTKVKLSKNKIRFWKKPLINNILVAKSRVPRELKYAPRKFTIYFNQTSLISLGLI